MIQFNGVHGHDSTFTEIASPVLVRIFVVYPVLDVVRKQILELDRGSKLEIELRILSVIMSAPLTRDVRKDRTSHSDQSYPSR